MEKDQKYQEQLRNMLKEIIGESTMDQAKEIAAETNEKVAKLLEQNKELADRLEAMEKMPAQKVELPVPGRDGVVKEFMYRGYNLKTQGASLSLPEEKKEGYAKFLIDCLQKAAMNEGTAAQGGFLVPDEYGDEILAFTRRSSVALQEATVYDMGTDTLRVPREASNVAVSWGNEAATLAASDPTVGELVLNAKRLGAYSTASNELLADSSFDIVSWLTSQFAEAIALEIDDSAFNAAGGSTFIGALSGTTTNTVSCAATGTSPNRHIQLTVDELSLAISKLTDNKLANAKFYFHLNSIHYVRVQEDGAGNKVWAQPGNGVPGTVYEYPYRVSDKIGSATPAAATPFALFGNFKNYVIGRRRGSMILEIDPYGLFTNYQTRFRMVTRWDAAPGLEAGMVAIKTHA